VQMTSNQMFHLRLRPGMKGKITQAIHKTNTAQSRIAFKAESKEAYQPCSKKEKDSGAKLQTTF